MDFKEQYNHPLWQRKRLETLDFWGFQCGNDCENTDSQLHVHHPIYMKGRKIWEYEPQELQVLCENCHKKAHKIDDKLKLELSHLCHDEKLDLLDFIDQLWKSKRGFGIFGEDTYGKD